MADTEPTPSPLATPEPVIWRGPLAFALLGVVGALGPDITPSRYYPDLAHYIPRYVLLGLSVGFGLSAVRSRARVDRAFGIAVLVVGICLVVYIVRACLRIID